MKNPIISAELQAAYEAAVREYGDHEDVTGIDIGFKYTRPVGPNGVKGAPERLGQLAVRFMVREKLAAEAIQARKKEKEKQREQETEKKQGELPRAVQGEPTDVIASRLDVTATGVQTPRRTKRFNPLQPGISVSHGARGAGTLGTLVYLEGSNAPVILSCWHVLAPENGRRGDAIYQPSLADGGNPRFDVVAHLERWFVDEDGDAAIALLTRGRMLETTLLESDVEIGSARRVVLGEVLEKSGRGTGVSSGLVDGVGRYRLTLHSGGPTWVEGFRLVPVEGADGPLSDRGDSGAVWFKRRNRSKSAAGVGLHIDGERRQGDPEYAIACHLPQVLERLEVSLEAAEDDHSLDQDVSADRFQDWFQRNQKSLKELLDLGQGNGNGALHARGGNEGNGKRGHRPVPAGTRQGSEGAPVPKSRGDEAGGASASALPGSKPPEPSNGAIRPEQPAA